MLIGMPRPKSGAPPAERSPFRDLAPHRNHVALLFGAPQSLWAPRATHVHLVLTASSLGRGAQLRRDPVERLREIFQVVVIGTTVFLRVLCVALGSELPPTPPSWRVWAAIRFLILEIPWSGRVRHRGPNFRTHGRLPPPGPRTSRASHSPSSYLRRVFRRSRAILAFLRYPAATCVSRKWPRLTRGKQDFAPRKPYTPSPLRARRLPVATVS